MTTENTMETESPMRETQPVVNVPMPVESPAATKPEPEPEPVQIPISQRLRNSVSGLTAAITGLEAAKGGKRTSAADLQAAMDADGAADTDLATAQSVFVTGCDDLIMVVRALRDSA